MEEGEEGVEIQDQGLAQATVASESRYATEKDGTGNPVGVHFWKVSEINSMWSGMMWNFWRRTLHKVLQSTRSIHMSVWLSSRSRNQERRERKRMVEKTSLRDLHHGWDLEHSWNVMLYLAYNPSFSKTSNTLSSFWQSCDRSVPHCFQPLNDILRN